MLAMRVNEPEHEAEALSSFPAAVKYVGHLWPETLTLTNNGRVLVGQPI
jgi:hypothetical protein